MKSLYDDNFQETILNATLPIIADIYSDGCVSCKYISPILAEAEDAYRGKISFFKLNAAFNEKIPAKYNVLSVPTLLFFNDKGEFLKSVTGLKSYEELEDKIKEIFK
ncbi:MAG: thioredoxin family protein [Firmicutes bacterium]|nr:thioredoxin family protein [Bacillota bacterium]